MKIEVEREMGIGTKAKFTIDEKEDKDALLMLAFIAEPMYCHLEGFKGNPVRLQARRAKGKEGGEHAGKTFTYIERVCYNDKGERATSVMGEYQEGGYYWKQWEVYKPETHNEY